MMELLDERPKGKTDYDHWISDGVILVKGKERKIFAHNFPTETKVANERGENKLS